MSLFLTTNLLHKLKFQIIKNIRMKLILGQLPYWYWQIKMMLKSNGENNPLEIILKKICFSKKYERPTKKIPNEILQNQLIKLVV